MTYVEVRAHFLTRGLVFIEICVFGFVSYMYISDVECFGSLFKLVYS